MKRTKLLVAAAAAAVLALAACGSTEGTATAQSPAGSEQGATQSADTEQTDPAAGEQQDADDTDEDADADAQAEDADDAAGGDAAGGDDTDAAGAESDDSVDDTDTATTISGDLDARTGAWFSTMCTGAVKPMFTAMSSIMGAGMAGAMAGLGQDGASDAPTAPADMDPKATQKKVVEELRAASNGISDTVEKLKAMPPPSLDHADEASAAIVEQMQQSGSMLADAADQLADANVTDIASLSQAIMGLDALEDDSASGLDLEKYELDDRTQEAIMDLPACQDAFGPFADLAGIGTDMPSPTN